METLTAQQFKEKYGATAYSLFGEEEKKETLFQEIKNAFSQGVSKVVQGYQEASATGGTKDVGGFIAGEGKILGGTAEAVSAPLAPILNRTVGKAISYIGGKIGSIPAVQKFASSPAGEKTQKVASTVADFANAAGLIAGFKGGTSALRSTPTKVAGMAEKISTPDVAKASQYVKGAVRDVVPTTQNLIDHNLARALDLTPGDLRNIAASTGNEIGPWLSQHNLIGRNKPETLSMVNGFFTDNYRGVRSEVGNVKTVYQPDQIPYFTESLKTLGAELQGKLGLEAVRAEIQGMLRRSKVSLDDVQRVKELIDEHFKLYKVTGDVQSGIAKQGLANVRKDIQTFIETEVQKNTGADIRAMNNNVATARSLADAIEARAPRGLTRAQLTWRDAAIGMGLTYFGSPLVGLSAVVVWKILTSPTIRLRFSRWLDSLNDAQKVKVSEAIRDGKPTTEMRKILEISEDDVTAPR